MIADKGYDADHLHEKIAETGAEIVIPPKRNRKVQRPYDAHLYKERNLIASLSASSTSLKQFRRVATRYDKLLANFMGFVNSHLAQIVKSSLRPRPSNRTSAARRFTGLFLSNLGVVGENEREFGANVPPTKGSARSSRVHTALGLPALRTDR